MKKYELEIEHRYQNRFVGSHRLKGDKQTTIIGSARDSDIRLLGDSVSGVHAAIELDENGQWTILDLGSEHGTWIKKRPIVEKVISQTTSLRIGGHHIKVTPKVLEHELFSGDRVQKKSLDGLIYHQIVVRKIGMVVTTALLEGTEAFVFHYGGKDYSIEATESTDWQMVEFGEEVVVQHRRTSSHIVESSLKERLQTGMDSSIKGPFLAAIGMLALFVLVLALTPKDVDLSMNELKPDKNRFTKMIYDAKAIRKKRKLAQKNRKHISGRSFQKNKTKSTNKAKTALASTKKGKSSSTAKVMTKLNASGLKRLLGKISSRKSKVAHFVRSNGKTANNRGLGRAVASVGKIGSSAGILNKTKKFKISGVSTAGKAGGSSSYRGIGGLAAGNVGNASVGILEEETEVMGGLERDVIAKVIEKNLGQITYCYERQLSANPELYGKVLVKFTIGAAGKVTTQKIGLTTLKSAMVEGCILRRVTGWKFPKPKGGTSVRVTYPFLFKSIN